MVCSVIICNIAFIVIFMDFSIYGHLATFSKKLIKFIYLFWEGHKFFEISTVNLNDTTYIGQICYEGFPKICGLLRILYKEWPQRILLGHCERYISDILNRTRYNWHLLSSPSLVCHCRQILPKSFKIECLQLYCTYQYVDLTCHNIVFLCLTFKWPGLFNWNQFSMSIII